MIEVYIYGENTLFIKETELGYIKTYLNHKNNPNISQLALEDLDYIIDRVFPHVCFGETDIGYEAVQFYFNDIVERQNKNTSKKFVIRTCITEIVSDILSYTRKQVIKASFFKIKVEGIDVSFNDNILLTSKDEYTRKFLNWFNHYELERNRLSLIDVE